MALKHVKAGARNKEQVVRASETEYFSCKEGLVCHLSTPLDNVDNQGLQKVKGEDNVAFFREYGIEVVTEVLIPLLLDV